MAGTGSGHTGSMASSAAAVVAAASRAALYDGELSAAREADGFGALTFSNGDVYRGEQLSPSRLPMHYRRYQPRQLFEQPLRPTIIIIPRASLI